MFVADLKIENDGCSRLARSIRMVGDRSRNADTYR